MKEAPEKLFGSGDLIEFSVQTNFKRYYICNAASADGRKRPLALSRKRQSSLVKQSLTDRLHMHLKDVYCQSPRQMCFISDLATSM